MLSLWTRLSCLRVPMMHLCLNVHEFPRSIFASSVKMLDYRHPSTADRAVYHPARHGLQRGEFIHTLPPPHVAHVTRRSASPRMFDSWSSSDVVVGQDGPQSPP